MSQGQVPVPRELSASWRERSAGIAPRMLKQRRKPDSMLKRKEDAMVILGFRDGVMGRAMHRAKEADSRIRLLSKFGSWLSHYRVTLGRLLNLPQPQFLPL